MLYRVSGNGLDKPSYIMGTHHLASVGFVEKVKGVKEALAETAQVCGEIVFKDASNPDTLKMLSGEMSLPKGTTLKDILSEDEYGRLDAFLAETMGVGFSNLQVAAQFGGLKPSALQTQLTVLLFLVSHMGEFDPSNTFDQYFQAQAAANNEPCIGLETVAFQTGLLYNGVSMERGRDLLMCLVDNKDFYKECMDSVTSAFYSQDLDALEKSMNAKLGGKCDYTDEEEHAMIYGRNARWAAELPAIMSKAPTFFAVGVGHLPGEKGLLNLLRESGYTVEGVE